MAKSFSVSKLNIINLYNKKTNNKNIYLTINKVLTPENDFNPDETETNSISTVNEKERAQLNVTILDIKPQTAIEFIKAYCKKCSKS